MASEHEQQIPDQEGLPNIMPVSGRTAEELRQDAQLRERLGGLVRTEVEGVLNEDFWQSSRASEENWGE